MEQFRTITINLQIEMVEVVLLRYFWFEINHYWFAISLKNRCSATTQTSFEGSETTHQLSWTISRPGRLILSRRQFWSHHPFWRECEVSKSFTMQLLKGVVAKEKPDGMEMGKELERQLRNNAQAQLDKWDNSIALKASRRTDAKQCSKARRKRGPALTFLQIEQFIVIV